MNVFDRMGRGGHELLLLSSDPEAGYRGIIALHDTALGPGLGGTRIWRYASDEEAIEDALRLSEAMSYKAAMAGLRSGGGKSVLMAPPGPFDRERVFRAHGRAIESLGGRYWAAEDVGTSVEDMGHIRTETRYVTGLAGRSGDPSPWTALGTFEGMRACARERWGAPDLAGRHVALQGVGNVGFHLCRLLDAAGVRLTVADVAPSRAERAAEAFGAEVVSPDRIHAVKADLFAPCALGGALSARTVEELRVEIVAGAANNQLDSEREGERLHERGILHAPDFVINAGGLISVYGEMRNKDESWTRGKVRAIHDTLAELLRLAREGGELPGAAALRMARERIAHARRERAREPGSPPAPVPPSSGRDAARTP